jgi:hypothetical protein
MHAPHRLAPPAGRFEGLEISFHRVSLLKWDFLHAKETEVTCL